MRDGVFSQLLDLACGVFLLAAVIVLWRRELTAIVRAFALQGLALGAVALLLGLHERRVELVCVALGVAVLRAGVLPYLLRRTLSTPAAGAARVDDEQAREARETRPVVNVSASLLAAAVLTLLAYAVCRPLVELDPTPATRALPVGVAAVLIGFLVLATRRRALAQVVGFLLLDNGITATAFLATSGVPLIVELGISFDVLLAVLVLQLLTTRVRDAFGTTDLDDLRELRD